MSADRQDAALGLPRATVPPDRTRNLQRWWTVITTGIAVVILLEAVFAGAMLSGVSWARAAHGVTAGILIASALGAGLVAVLTLRRLSHGLKLSRTLFSLAAAFFL